MTELVLHGLACRFGKTVPYDQGYLHVAPGAFNQFLAAPDRHVALTWGGHDSDETVASTRDRSLRLLADKNGLWFRAVIADPTSRRCGAITRSLLALNQVSVNFLVNDERDDVWLLGRRRSIRSTGADHITLLTAGAFGRHCAVWAPLANLERAPERIRDLEDQFQNVAATSTTVEFAHARVVRR